MAKPLYRQYFNDMFAQNQELFLRFKLLNDDYAKNRQKFQEEFNSVGKVVVDIINDWERKLCSHMERGQNGVYSQNLGDKFWTEVRSYFPMIDFVGVKITTANTA